MPRRQFEDRVTLGKIRVRRGASDGVYGQGPEGPVLPPLAGTRADVFRGQAGATLPDAAHHESLSTVHSHEHSDGHGRVHAHLHSHANDNAHSGEGHQHTPGQPDDSMPSVDMNSAAIGGETRDAGGIGLAEQIARYLASQGVDVGRAVAELGYKREHQAERAAERAVSAQDLARSLAKAKRALDFETSGWLEHRTGFSLSRRNEAAERVTELEGLLRECCVNDPEIISEAKRLAAR